MINPLYWLELRIRVREKRLWVLAVFFALTMALITVVALASSLSWRREMIEPASLGSGLIWSVLYTQAGLLIILAPLASAGKISQEREQRTLAALINTPLSRFRIAVGKLWGAWTFVLWLGLLAMPFLFVGTLWGGESWYVIVVCLFFNLAAGLTLSSAALGFSGLFGRSLTAYLVTGAFLFGWTVVVPLVGGLIANLADLTLSQIELLGYAFWYHNPFFPLIIFGSADWGLSGTEIVLRLVYCLFVWSLLAGWGVFQATKGLKREVY